LFETDRDFQAKTKQAINRMAGDKLFRELSCNWLQASLRHRYSYNFRWLGLPIIQYPADVIAMQEIIWEVQPSLIIETGVARGGSLVFYASLLELLGGERTVIGVELALQPENRAAIANHPLARRIRLIDGSSVAPEVLASVKKEIGERSPVMVILDSNHTHDHVLAELRAYAPLVTPGSYLVVFDTIIEDLPEDTSRDRPWGRGNNPKTAVDAFLKDRPEFEQVAIFDDKLLLSVCRGGILRRLT
jgi:cephalosporin hydroxylase